MPLTLKDERVVPCCVWPLGPSRIERDTPVYRGLQELSDQKYR